jgi:diaminopimelate decarboxylase
LCISCNIPGTQFGLDIDSGEALKTAKEIIINKNNLNLNTIHFHVTSNAKNTDIYKKCSEKAIKLMKDLKNIFKAKIEYLDIGGGMGVASSKNMSPLEYGIYRLFGVLPKQPDISAYLTPNEFLEDIFRYQKSLCLKNDIESPKIIIEPGRLITSAAETLFSKVMSIKKKKNGKIYVITDAGRLSTTFPCDFEYHFAFVAEKYNKNANTLYNIMGRVCTSADWTIKNILMPEIEIGNNIMIMDAGAYFTSYSTNFAFPRPAIVMTDNGDIVSLRKRETFEHLTDMDCI